MKARAMHCLAAAATAGVMLSAAAQETPASVCELPPSEAHPITDRHGTLLSYEKMPQHCLKAMFMRCAAQAGEQLLDLGSAAVCSIGYEALLRRGFAGDFHALMAWWRTQRDGSGMPN